MVGNSWRRSLDSGVNPSRISAPRAVGDDGLHSLRKRCNELIEAARPVMAQAREFLVELGTVMVLTDHTGVILWTEGDTGAKDHAQGIQLVPGALWTEAGSGTNAIGTALATGQPVQICAAEHFVESVKQWTCSAAVIHDPCDGQLLGGLDISGLSGAHNMHCLALAVTGAGRIESRLAAIEMEKRARLLDLTLNHSPRWGDGGLVVFDRRGRLVRANKSGGQFLESKGLSLTSCGDIGIAAFVENPAARSPHLPEWLRREWLQSVMDRDERLGAVLAIPPSGRPATTAQPIAAIPSYTGEERACPIQNLRVAACALRSFETVKNGFPPFASGNTDQPRAFPHTAAFSPAASPSRKGQTKAAIGVERSN